MSGHLLSGFDVSTGSFAFVAVGGGVALIAVGLLAWLLLRRAGQRGMAGALGGCALALVAAMFAYAFLDGSTAREQATERRAIEARAAELTVRAIAPGSALACLDEVASTVVENACEKPLFASPEAVAAAVGYVDARFSLLAASAALAQRDPSYRPVLERLRRSLEADRFGLVAHVLATRGCNGADCAELRLLHDPAHVVANMKSHAFETSLGAHALAWQPNGAGASVAALPQMSGLSPTPLTTNGAGLGNPALASAPPAAGGPGSAKLDFPSASSIPAVSIMTPEPGTPAEAELRRAAPPPLPPKRAAAPRRQTAREAATAQAPAPTSPPQRAAPAAAAAAPPPVQIAPEAEQAVPPAGPVQHNVY